MRKNKGAEWIWNHLDRTWRRLRSEDIWPEQVIVMDARVGGCDTEDPLSARKVECKAVAGEASEAASHHGRVRVGIRSLPGTFHSTVHGSPKMVFGDKRWT